LEEPEWRSYVNVRCRSARSRGKLSRERGAESVRILRNPGGGSGMKGHSCLYASTSDTRETMGKRAGRMFSIIGPVCQARLIKSLALARFNDMAH